MGYVWVPVPDCKIRHKYGEDKWRPGGVNSPHEHYVWNSKENQAIGTQKKTRLLTPVNDKEVIDAVAATLQACLNRAQAEVCALDIIHMFILKSWIVAYPTYKDPKGE